MICMNAEPPLWRSIHAALEQDLAAGAFPPGTPLPAERLLAERFGCAIGTVRRAVDELVAARALVRRQGRGTFVPDLDGAARVPRDVPDRTQFYFLHIARADGLLEPPRTELLDFRTPLPCAPDHAALLGLEAGAPMHRAQNLQYLQGQPVMLDELWMPAGLFPGLDAEGFAGREGTIYGLYQRRFGLSVLRTEERLRAEAASPDIAALLGLEPAAPVLRILRVAHAIGDRPVELRLSWVDTREHEYRNSLG
jgi:GntR family transcriptional regulator